MFQIHGSIFPIMEFDTASSQIFLQLTQHQLGQHCSHL